MKFLSLCNRLNFDRFDTSARTGDDPAGIVTGKYIAAGHKSRTGYTEARIVFVVTSL
jgi:hypothetical protein